MTTIAVQADDVLEDNLSEIARAKQISVQDAVREALLRYVRSWQVTEKARYSFIGIAQSGKGGFSRRVDKTPAEGADRNSHDSRTVLLQQAGALADDATLGALLTEIYRQRGQPETEDSTHAVQTFADTFGAFRDDPTLAAFLEEVTKYRHQRDQAAVE